MDLLAAGIGGAIFYRIFYRSYRHGASRRGTQHHDDEVKSQVSGIKRPSAT